METIIEIPKLEDFKKVNKLAKQVHELHVNWRPDLFLSVDEVISKEDFKQRRQAKEIFVAKIKNEIVGYTGSCHRARQGHQGHVLRPSGRR